MAFFAQKTSCLGEFLVDFLLMERGGGVLHPSLNGRSVAQKVNGKGWYPPPPFTTISRTRIIEPFPKRFEHFEHFDN